MDIITSSIKLEVGKVYTEKEIGEYEFMVYEEIYKSFRFLVTREATLEEYKNQVILDGYPHLELVICSDFYYEVSMD